MSDPKWPDEPFTAKHNASGTPVKVTPIDYLGEPDLWPQSMRVEGGPVQEIEHWADRDARLKGSIRQRLAARGVKTAEGTLMIDTIEALLTMVEAMEARIAKLETLTPPPEGT